MQLFINNWTSRLTTPVTASAFSFFVPPADAGKLIDLGGDSYYVLTLVEVDGNGKETGWEIVKVTEVDGGLTVVRGQEGTAPREWAAGSLIAARATKGALEALQSVSPASSYLTRENFASQVKNGALGIQSPIAIFARDNVGAYIFSADNGALKAMLPWLTTTLVKGLVAVGPYKFSGNESTGIVVDSNGLVALSTGDSAYSGCSATIRALALISNYGVIESGSFVQGQVRVSALSGGEQRYFLSVTLSLPPFDGVLFRYGAEHSEDAEYSESEWSVWWRDASGVSQSFFPGEALLTTVMSYLRIEIIGDNMACMVNGSAIHTIPLDDMYKTEEATVPFGVSVRLNKVIGDTPALVGLGTPSGRLTLITE